MVGVVVIEGPAPRVVWFGLGDHPQRDPGAEAELSAGPTQAAAAALGGITVHDTPEASARVKAHQARALLKRVLEGAPCR
jgi:CO/xanthine dehydrogenase FAD-binding subunit